MEKQRQSKDVQSTPSRPFPLLEPFYLLYLSYLRALHINDSKTDLGSRRDRHENIGQYVPLTTQHILHFFPTIPLPYYRGHIGIDPFIFIVTDPRLRNIPLILETPSFEDPKVWQKEVDVLNRLSGPSPSISGSPSSPLTDDEEADNDHQDLQSGKR